MKPATERRRIFDSRMEQSSGSFSGARPCVPKEDRAAEIDLPGSLRSALLRRKNVVARLAVGEVRSPPLHHRVCLIVQRNLPAFTGLRLALAYRQQPLGEIDLHPSQETQLVPAETGMQSYKHDRVKITDRAA